MMRSFLPLVIDKRADFLGRPATRGAAAEAKRDAEGWRKGDRKAAPPSPTPDAKAQKNFTDPQSRIMKSKDGFVQAYNAQIAVGVDSPRSR